MEDKKRNLRPLARLAQLVFFFALFYIIICLVLNYCILGTRYANIVNNPDSTIDKATYFKFKTEYILYPPKTMSIGMALMCTGVLALLVVFKLDQLYNITHANKDIKGKDRFMTTNEIGERLYSFSSKDMKSAEKSGIILALEKGKYYIDAETIHSLIIGTTRSGKGQTFVLPMIRHIAMSKAKHSMVLNDPKGELLENGYDMLIENGYEVKVINLRDTELSHLWNPLQIIIDEYKYAKDNNKDLSKTNKLISSLAAVFTDNPKSDPIWPESAKSLLIAMILYLLENGYKDGKLENVSMYSVYQMFIDFGTQNEVCVQGGAKKMVNALDELFQLLAAEDPTNPAVSAYSVSQFSSGEMRSSIFSTLASNINIFGSDAGISKLTSGNQINFTELINPDKPMAIFMVVPDNDSSRYVIASLFVNQCYNTLVELSSKYQGQRLPQRVHFILDEFGNMVRIPEMDTKITVGAGRNILFNLFIQDLNQLDTKYDNAAKTIRSNCGNLVYINSTDKDTNDYMSAILGTKTIEYNTYSGDLTTWLNHQSGVVDSAPLMTATELANMPFGSAVTKRQRCYPIKTLFTPYYKLKLPVTTLSAIAEKMDLKDIPLSKTIYPMYKLWQPLFTEIKDPQTGQPLYDENGEVMTRWNDKRIALSKVQYNAFAKTLHTNYAAESKPSEESADAKNSILIKIDEISKGKFETAFNAKDFDKCKRLIRQAQARKLLDTAEREYLDSYIEQFYNL